ncbi:nucleotidyltransferase MB21D2-like [Eretmochelys imbricata]
MTSPEWGSVPRPAQPLTDLDFHSGARIAELNQLVQELSKRTARDPGVRATQELVVLKDFVFSLLGLVQQLDGRLPLANEYLLLSGGARQGTVDMDPGVLGRSAPGADYDADYTLLVPVLQARGCPVTLDMCRCPPGHAWLALGPFGPEACHRWADCCRDHGGEAYLAPGLVSAWFSQALGAVADRVRAAPCRGGPVMERVAGHGGLVTLLLSHGTVRALYDVVPVVAFQGWPAVAQEWLGRSHFWDGKLREEDVAGGFYLLPGSGPAWREASGPVEASGPAWREASGPVEASGPAWREASGPVEASGPAWREASGPAGREASGPAGREASGPVEASGPAWREASGPVEASGPAWREASGPVEASGPAWREASGPVEASGPAWREASGPVEASGPAGREASGPAWREASGLAWRLSFSRSELHLKKAVPPPLLQAYRAARAALGGAWGGRAGPYHLWTLVLWACERLPARYLGREENAAHCLLGLLDDMAAGLGAGAGPHYFLPGYDRLAGVPEPGLARAVAAVRGDPAGHLREAVERVKMAAKLGRGLDAGAEAEE